MSELASSSIVLPQMPMYIADIRHYLPHAYPFLLVDRVVSMQFGKIPHISAYKNVTMNEEFFQGHFPQYPLMPGVMMMEALAQVCGILGMVMVQKTPQDGVGFLFAGMDEVRFKRPVVPGDQLNLDAELLLQKRGIYKFAAQASVAGKIAAQADIILSQQHITL